MVLAAPIRLFVLARLSTRPTLRLLEPVQKDAEAERKVLFKTLPRDFSLTSFERTDDPARADFFIVPQAVKAVTPDVTAYLDRACEQARAHGKKIIVFLTGDLCHKVHIDRPEVTVLTGSIYTSSCHVNEVVFAPFTEDLGEQRGIVARPKQERPVVSFCGYAGFPSWKTRVKYHLSNLWYDLVGKPVYKRGIYFRRRALHALRHDPRITTSFIIRDSFSANGATIGNDAARLRAEYLDNLVESDYVLCPKGDANFSSRFYETLSLGRVPVLIDTEMRLPLEHRIDYSTFIIRVPHTEVNRVGDFIARHHAALSDADFRAMQEAARAAYLAHLRFDAYYNEMLPLLREGGIRAVL